MARTGRIETGGREWDWRLAAAVIVGMYVGLVVLWMVGSDMVVAWLEPGPDLEQKIAFWRRIGFTIVTSIVMFVLVARTLRERGRVEREVREARERYELAIRGTNDGIWDWDIEKDEHYWSPRLEELLGFAEGEMNKGRLEWSERLHEEDRERALAALKEHLEKDARYDLTYRLRRKDESFRWFRTRGKAVRDSAGKPVRMAGSLTDVHERIEAEHLLRQNEERYRQTFNTNQAIKIVLDAQTGRLVDVNDAACRFYGYSRERLLTMSIFDINTAPRPEILERMEQLTKGSKRFEFKHRLASGEVRDVEVYTGPFEFGGKRMFYSIIHDVTERSRARRALGESEERYRRIVETAREGIWVADTLWRTTFVNTTMARMLGYAPEEMVGRHLFDFMDDQARAECEKNMGRREEGIAEQHDFRLRRKDGAALWVMMSTNAIIDEHGSFSGALAMVTDITERKAAESLRGDQNLVLEMIASGAPLERTLDEVVRMVQRQVPAALGSILGLDELRRVSTLSAPDLPAAYSRAIDGLEIGPGVGSCGTAMHERKRVVVSDVLTSEYWTPYRALATQHGLRACWSEPIMSSDERVLGSMAMYFRTVREPEARELATITTAAHLAGIAIDRARAEGALQESEATKRALLGAIPDLMFRVDRNAVYLDYHAPDESRLQVPAREFLGKRVSEVLTPDRAARCLRSLEALFLTGEPQSYEYDVRRPDGSRAWWEVRVVRAGDDEALLLLRDITARRQAERRQRESEQRLRLLVENTPLGVIQWGTDFTVSAWNPGAERLFGHAAAEALGRHASFIVPESARRYVDDLWRDLRANTGGFRASNQNLRKDGTLVWCEWYNSPLVDATGNVIGVASVVEDVTERRLAQQRQDFMMAELDHRVKNNLAAVISLAEQTGRSAAGYKDFADKFMGRLRAMSRMHSVLARSRWQGADLLTLVTQTLEAFGSGSAGRANAQGPSLMLGPRAAQAMAMALNELATNAVKYGALSSAGGRVEVSWTVETGSGEGKGGSVRRLLFTWTESGGPTVSPPERRGFGSELIEGAIAYELRGTVRLRFEPEGVVCEMVVPLTEEIEEVINERVWPENGAPAKPVVT